MKKAFELSVLTGTQVLLLVVSETGLVYTFSTPKFEPIVTQQEGRNLIQACLNAPDEEEEEDDEGDPNRMNQLLPLQQPMQQQQLQLHPGMGMMEGDREGMLPPMGIPPSNHAKNGSIDSADASNISMSANGSYSYSMSGMEGINDMDNGRNIIPTQNMLRQQQQHQQSQQQQQQPRQHSSGIRMQPEIKTELKSPMSLNRSVLGANDYVTMQQAQQNARSMHMPQQPTSQQRQQQQQQQLQPPPPLPQQQQQQQQQLQQFQQLGMVQGHSQVPIPPQMGKQGYMPNQPQQQQPQQQQQRLQPQSQPQPPQQQYLGVDHAGNYQNYFQDYQQNQF